MKYIEDRLVINSIQYNLRPPAFVILIPETFKILCNSKILDLKLKFFIKHMTEPKKKMFIFQQSNKKSIQFNGRGRLLRKITKREKIVDIFNFLSIYKKKSHLLSL